MQFSEQQNTNTQFKQGQTDTQTNNRFVGLPRAFARFFLFLARCCRSVCFKALKIIHGSGLCSGPGTHSGLRTCLPMYPGLVDAGVHTTTTHMRGKYTYEKYRGISQTHQKQASAHLSCCQTPRGSQLHHSIQLKLQSTGATATTAWL